MKATILISLLDNNSDTDQPVDFINLNPHVLYAQCVQKITDAFLNFMASQEEYQNINFPKKLATFNESLTSFIEEKSKTTQQ